MTNSGSSGSSALADWRSPNLAERRIGALLFALLIALSLPLLIDAWRHHVLKTDESPLLYHAATLAFNYVDFGIVRRGLAGTVLRFIDPNLLRATAVFHVLSAIAVSAVACWLFVRLHRTAWQKAAFALVLVALMARWADDAGRSDMAVAALLGLAAILAVRSRPALSACCVGIALAVHESGYVFGIPLLLTLLVDQGRWRRISARALWSTLAVVGATLLLYAVLPLFPHADAHTMAESVRARLPRSEIVDWAIYYAISGSRGVETSVCQNRIDPTYARHIFSGAFVIGLVTVVLRAGRFPHWLVAAFASLVPYAFLCIVANDTARWTCLGAFNAWLVCAATPAGGMPGRWRDALRVAGGALVVALVHPAGLRGAMLVYVPAPIVDRVAHRLGAPRTAPFATMLARCDADWRSVLDLDAVPASR